MSYIPSNRLVANSNGLSCYGNSETTMESPSEEGTHSAIAVGNRSDCHGDRPAVTQPDTAGSGLDQQSDVSPATTHSSQPHSHPHSSHPHSSHHHSSHPLFSHPHSSHPHSSHPLFSHPHSSHPLSSHPHSSHPHSSHPHSSHPLSSHPLSSHPLSSHPLSSHPHSSHLHSSHPNFSHPHPHSSHPHSSHPHSSHPHSSHPHTSHPHSSHPHFSHTHSSHPHSSHPHSHSHSSHPHTSHPYSSHPHSSHPHSSHPHSSHPHSTIKNYHEISSSSAPPLPPPHLSSLTPHTMKRTVRRRRSRRLLKQGEMEDEEEEEEEEERERVVGEKGKGRKREGCVDPALPGTSEGDREGQSSAHPPTHLTFSVPLSRVAGERPSVSSSTPVVVGEATDAAGEHDVSLPTNILRSNTNHDHPSLGAHTSTECRHSIETHQKRHQPQENTARIGQDRAKEDEEVEEAEEEEEEEAERGEEEVERGIEGRAEPSFGGRLFGFIPNWTTPEKPSHSMHAVDGSRTPQHTHRGSGHTPCLHSTGNRHPVRRGLARAGDFQLVPTMSSSRGFSVNVEITGRPRPGARNTIDLSVEMGEGRSSPPHPPIAVDNLSIHITPPHPHSSPLHPSHPHTSHLPYPQFQIMHPMQSRSSPPHLSHTHTSHPPCPQFQPIHYPQSRSSLPHPINPPPSLPPPSSPLPGTSGMSTNEVIIVDSSDDEDDHNVIIVSSRRQSGGVDRRQRQIARDEDLARHLQAQFDREVRRRGMPLSLAPPPVPHPPSSSTSHTSPPHPPHIMPLFPPLPLFPEQPVTGQHDHNLWSSRGPSGVIPPLSSTFGGDSTTSYLLNPANPSEPTDDLSALASHLERIANSDAHRLLHIASLSSRTARHHHHHHFIRHLHSHRRMLPEAIVEAVMGSGSYEELLELAERLGPAQARGLSREAINSLPTRIHRKKDGEDQSCVVCMSTFAPREKLRSLLPCQHSFHLKCIDRWLKDHNTCPICRVQITARQ